VQLPEFTFHEDLKDMNIYIHKKYINIVAISSEFIIGILISCLQADTS